MNNEMHDAGPEAGAGAPPPAAEEPGADAPGAPPEEADPARAGFKVTDRRFWAQSEEERAAEAERPQLPTYVERLRQEAADKDRQLREYIAAYKKEVVEGLEKTKQRLERDAGQRVERKLGELATPMMEVLDTLERSIAAAESSRDYAALVQGVKMVHLLMLQKLGELGLTRIETLGQPFDPLVHEAVAMVPVKDPARDRTVVGELRPGFRLGERVIRPAVVQVGKLEG